MRESLTELANLQDKVLVLDKQQQAHALALDPALYASLESRFVGFHGCYLLSESTFNASWSMEEMHPAGDEVLYLLAGRCDMVLYREVLQRLAFATPGQVLVVPKGCWHRADIQPGETCRILFMTPGAGTEQRPRQMIDAG